MLGATNVTHCEGNYNQGLIMGMLHHVVIISMFVLRVNSTRGEMNNAHRSRNIPNIHRLEKRSMEWGDATKEYIYCYDKFDRVYTENAGTYHGLCHARDKLKICKGKVKEEYPHVEETIVQGHSMTTEVVADFWCTYNITHHRPVDPFSTMETMYLKYLHCPYKSKMMVSLEDYSAKTSLSYSRQKLAEAILCYTGARGLSMWQPRHKYSEPRDPVFKALSARWCDVYKQQLFIIKLMKKYCVLVAGIHSDLTDVEDTFERHKDGLFNWTTSMCVDYEDSLEQVMRITKLEKYLMDLKKPGLAPCHEHNIYIAGARCLIMFHTRLPPYSDIHNFMGPFNKNIPELNSCWDQVISGCPYPRSESRNISLIIEIHNLASDISKQDPAQVWDVLFLWSDLFKKTGDAQWILQNLYIQLEAKDLSGLSKPLALGSSLKAALNNHNSPLSKDITSLFDKLSSALRNISLITNDDFTGVNIFEGLFSMDKYVLSLLLAGLQPLCELFLEVAQFVQYNRRCPEWWWPEPCQ